MVKATVLSILTLLLWLPAIAAGSTLPEHLYETGKGEAYYLKFIKVYDATLYSSGNAATEGILGDKVSKCLLLNYAVGVKQTDFVKAAMTVLNKQFTEQQLNLVQEGINQVHAGYQDVSKGDSYTLCYNSDNVTTTLAYNGNPIVSVNSADFARVYFSIWLGEEKPLDKTLRNDLLAGINKG